jgi:uncharacterized protein YggU (UPF0235/DUF167 family)
MRIFVKAKPNAKFQSLEVTDETHFIVSVKEPPVQGAANQAIARILSGYFNISISAVRLIKGFRERNKIFEIFTEKK